MATDEGKFRFKDEAWFSGLDKALTSGTTHWDKTETVDLQKIRLYTPGWEAL